MSTPNYGISSTLLVFLLLLGENKNFLPCFQKEVLLRATDLLCSNARSKSKKVGELVILVCMKESDDPLLLLRLTEETMSSGKYSLFYKRNSISFPEFGINPSKSWPQNIS